MKRFVIALLAFVSLASVAACTAEPERSVRSTNGGAKAELVTTFEGISLYRVHDGSRVVYVAASSTRTVADTSWSESCGKNCTREEGVVAVK